MSQNMPSKAPNRPVAAFFIEAGRMVAKFIDQDGGKARKELLERMKNSAPQAAGFHEASVLTWTDVVGAPQTPEQMEKAAALLAAKAMRYRWQAQRLRSGV